MVEGEGGKACNYSRIDPGLLAYDGVSALHYTARELSLLPSYSKSLVIKVGSTLTPSGSLTKPGPKVKLIPFSLNGARNRLGRSQKGG